MDGNTVQYTTPLLTSCTVQSLSVYDYLEANNLKMECSFEKLVTTMIINELLLDNWTTDFCFLYFYCVGKVYITISDLYSGILQQNAGKRKRVYLHHLGLTPYKLQTKEKKKDTTRACIKSRLDTPHPLTCQVL